MKEQILNYVERNSYFQCDDWTDKFLFFTTRLNGDVYNEEYSETDYNEAVKLKEGLSRIFKGVQVNIETVDEWVNVEVQYKF